MKYIEALGCALAEAVVRVPVWVFFWWLLGMPSFETALKAVSAGLALAVLVSEGSVP